MLKRAKVLYYDGKSGRGVVRDLQTNKTYEGPVVDVGANYRLRLALDGLAGRLCLIELVQGQVTALRLLKGA